MQNLHSNEKTLDLKEHIAFVKPSTRVAKRHNVPTSAAIKTLELFVPVFLRLTGANEQIERKNQKQITEQVKSFKKNCVVVTKP